MISWIASYPKSGNTWMRIFIANLLRSDGLPADINALAISSFASRSLWESYVGWKSSLMPRSMIFRLRPAIQECIASLEDRIFFKTHDSFVHPNTGEQLFSSAATGPSIYIIRNPFDVVVSLSNHLGKSIGDAIELLNSADGVFKSPSLFPQPLGTWRFHVESWLHQPEVKCKVVRYEDMLQHGSETFAGVAAHLGLSSGSRAVSQALSNSAFDLVKEQEQNQGFREAPAGRTFFRSGKSDTWRGILTKDQIDAIMARHHALIEKYGYTP